MTKEAFGYLQKCIFTVRCTRHIDRQTWLTFSTSVWGLVTFTTMNTVLFHPSPVQVAIVMSWFAGIVEPVNHWVEL